MSPITPEVFFLDMNSLPITDSEEKVEEREEVVR